MSQNCSGQRRNKLKGGVEPTIYKLLVDKIAFALMAEK
jgi:hypothetical protein